MFSDLLASLANGTGSTAPAPVSPGLDLGALLKSLGAGVTNGGGLGNPPVAGSPISGPSPYADIQSGLSGGETQLSRIPALSPAVDPNVEPERKGIFGMHGTLRNIIGALGDAFLVQSGHKPAFQDGEDARDKAWAMRDLATDPMGAVTRLARDAHDGDAAQSLYTTAASQAATDAQIAQKKGLLVRDRLGAIMGTVKADGSNYAPVLDMAKKYAAANNMPLDLPDEYDPDALAAYKNGSLTADQQQTIEARRDQNNAMMGFRYDREGHLVDYRDRRLGQIDRTIDINAGRAKEDARHHGATEVIGAGNLKERGRHDTVTEGQGAARVTQGAQRVAIAQQRAASGGRRPPPGGGAVPSFQGPNDPAYQKAPPGTHFTIPGSPHVYTKGK